VCAADGGSETAPDPVSLLRNYHQAAMQVSAEDVDETLQGKAVGAAIQRRRAAVIQQIIEGQAGS